MCKLEIIVEMFFSVKKKWVQHKVICLQKNCSVQEDSFKTTKLYILYE